MSEAPRDRLDELLAKVPRDVRPKRDLWAAIQAEIDPAQVAQPRPRRVRTMWQIAAGVLLVVGSSAMTYFVMREQAPQAVQAKVDMPTPALTAMPAKFGGQELGADYEKTHAALEAQFERRIATLPPVTRAKLRRNLGDLRKAAHEIAQTLAQQPSNPLLQELLMSTYQSELQLLTQVNEMPATGSAKADL
jgi:glycerol-3-phosphate dehydrogenase